MYTRIQLIYTFLHLIYSQHTRDIHLIYSHKQLTYTYTPLIYRYRYLPHILSSYTAINNLDRPNIPICMLCTFLYTLYSAIYAVNTYIPPIFTWYTTIYNCIQPYTTDIHLTYHLYTPPYIHPYRPYSHQYLPYTHPYTRYTPPRTCEIYLIHSHIRLIYTYTHLTPYIQPTYTWYTPYIRPYATCIHPCTPYTQPYKIYIHVKYGNIHPSSPHSPSCLHLIFSLYSPINT